MGGDAAGFGQEVAVTVIDDLVDAIGDRIFGKKADKAPAERSNRELTKYGYKRRDGIR